MSDVVNYHETERRFLVTGQLPVEALIMAASEELARATLTQAVRDAGVLSLEELEVRVMLREEGLHGVEAVEATPEDDIANRTVREWLKDCAAYDVKPRPLQTRSPYNASVTAGVLDAMQKDVDNHWLGPAGVLRYRNACQAYGNRKFCDVAVEVRAAYLPSP